MTGNFLDRSDIGVNRAAEINQILLREAEVAELWAQLSLDPCQARVAAARVGAIATRLAARPR